MYINDVIRQVKHNYPSEYDEIEMYVWCDEVSSMLAVEDRNVYKEIYLSTDKSGSVLLPEGVRIENINSVSADGRKLKKQNIVYKDRRLGGGLPASSVIRIIYIEPYRPIRLTRYRGEAIINSAQNYINIGTSEFLTGDTLNIGILSNSGELLSSVNEIPILSVEYAPEEVGRYILYTKPNTLPEDADGIRDCVITRVITEKTVCAEPYDSMYIDYILAKINLYQRDTESYNHHMTAFNSRLSAYKKWLINHMPPENGRLENWW